MYKIVLLSLFFFTGCDIIDHFEEKNAKKQFRHLCEKDPDLIICNGPGKKSEELYGSFIDYEEHLYFYGVEDIPDLYFYTLSNFSVNIYTYKADKNDSYDYLYLNSNYLRSGDCDDYVVTFIEDNNKLHRPKGTMFSSLNI